MTYLHERMELEGAFLQPESVQTTLSLAQARMMYASGRIIGTYEPYGWLSMSVAASGDGIRRHACVVHARVIGSGDQRRVEVVSIPLYSQKTRSMVLAGCLMVGTTQYPKVAHAIDSSGAGLIVCQELEDMGHTVYRMQLGAPCFTQAQKDQYINRRAQVLHAGSEAVRQGRLSVLTSELQDTLLIQAASVPDLTAQDGRKRMPHMSAVEWFGADCIDLWETICFAFSEVLDIDPVQ